VGSLEGVVVVVSLGVRSVVSVIPADASVKENFTMIVKIEINFTCLWRWGWVRAIPSFTFASEYTQPIFA